MTKDEKAIRKPLEKCATDFLTGTTRTGRAGTAYSPSSYRVCTKDELRGWIAALE